MPQKVCCVTPVSLTHERCVSHPRIDLANIILVAKHNSAESCWVIIHDKVYDVRQPPSLPAQLPQLKP